MTGNAGATSRMVGPSRPATARRPYVIDTSVAIKWYIPEAHSGEATAYIDKGVDRHAPDYLLVEAASVVLKRLRNRDVKLRLAVDEGQMVMAALRVSPIQFHESRPLIDSAFALAEVIGGVPLRRPVPGLDSSAWRAACHRRRKAVQKDPGQPARRVRTLGRGRSMNRGTRARQSFPAQAYRSR
jgi:predicted nucleic acid-binding protein